MENQKVRILWIVGPSGAGKSFTLPLIRKNRALKARFDGFDLDWVGCKGPDGQWMIMHSVFDVLVERARISGKHIVCAGADATPDAMLDKVESLEGRVISLIPSVDRLLENRRSNPAKYCPSRPDLNDTLGRAATDEIERVKASADIASWTKIVQRWGPDRVLECSSVEQVLSVLTAIISEEN